MEKLAEVKEYPFEFSVVMAVYNVEPFLREAVDSLIAQDFGFEHIQLIMVDDGSTDSSGAICDEYAEQYPENIMVIHKENGGVSSARNAGIPYAVGRFINFMDSDDKFNANAFRKVYEFFLPRENIIDVAAIPHFFFGDRRGTPWQNRKFKKWSRVIDLKKEYTASLMTVNASFFHARRKNDIVFDTALDVGEDMKVALALLLDKMLLGAVSGCKYWYRKVQGGNSLIDTSQQKKSWYTAHLEHCTYWAYEYCMEKLGYFPMFVQYAIVYDLAWRFKQKQVPAGILSEEELVEYKEKLFDCLRLFDDKAILEQKQFYMELLTFLMELKYARKPDVRSLENEDSQLYYGNTVVWSVAKMVSYFDFIELSESSVCLEGRAMFCGCDDEEKIDIIAEVNGSDYYCTTVERDANLYSVDKIYFRAVSFCVNVPLDKDIEQYNIFIKASFRGNVIRKRDLRFSRFAPLSKMYKNSCYCRKPWMLTKEKNKLVIRKYTVRKYIKQEYAFLRELWKVNKRGTRKAVLARLAYHILKTFKRKPIWLVSDRIMKADDNGEAFFNYMQQYHKEDINTYFVLSKNSTDFDRISKIGPVVDSLSFKHKLLHLLCDYNISSQADAITDNPFNAYYESYRDILQNVCYVFLQHGVIKDDLSDWLNRYNKNMTGFITSAYAEYESILHGQYFYDATKVWLTGLPRFDRLYNNEQKYITIMPTWREYLMNSADTRTGIWALSSGFIESTFFHFYNELINNDVLLSAASKYGYTLQFMPHPTLQPHLDVFTQNENVRFLDLNAKYSDVYAESNLIITDYSSAIFDFAYLRKPIVYCHFDAKEFFAGEHVYTKGYFDYERDGFGEVEYDLENTVDRIVEYMANGCQLKDKYRERIDKFFAFNDQNNCQRVYEKIIELDKQ